ncbi:TonB-dependent receptor [Sphingosinicella terrae]|uniref:TonB-dependent receptor n=1 Tax=Sphingosinicella terrae TaxID=2172047 RepID=UPI000E0D0F3E|nr:TonB-dependent receptor [Sphingosinicella terrae]
MILVARLASLLVLLAPAQAVAQELAEAEVVVTGARREADDFEESRPAIGLRRTADFAVMGVTIAGDTRDSDRRREEIWAMVRSAIEVAGRSGVELATGNFVLEPLTLANHRNLQLLNDGRPDTDRVYFLAKVRLGAGGDAAAAIDRIQRFVRAVPPYGRAEMRASGDLTLSVVGPDQYRGQILDLIAADSRATAARFGPAYAVTASGLDRPVEWMRAGLTEIFLYVPYNIVVVPTDQSGLP